MRPIGFSTGALAKGDFRHGVALQHREERIQAIELSALRDHELPLLVDAVPALELRRFPYVSVHAPSRLQTLAEEDVFAMLLRLPEAWPVIAHADLLHTPSLWQALGARLCIENMDDRKTTGRTVEELRTLFALYPDASFCLDLGHARQIDPTMTSALRMLREFGARLRQVHVSDVGTRGEHLPLGVMARRAFTHVAHRIPERCPLIIESVIAAEAIGGELDAVRLALPSNANAAA
ncbi:MAG TPA: hypothetical protein VHW00_09295 [Thermoanaerobaculia bacterium]|nr:hypothetical protein [Thermoanaerobaculia bacterium]